MAALSFTQEELDAATALLAELIRINTTNPPGNEAPAMERLAKQLEHPEVEIQIVGESRERPNLVAKYAAAEANRRERPLILSCHLDVVPADESRWKHPPFSGHNDGDYLWGRGAIDMKGFAVMAVATFQKLVTEKRPLNRDLIFVAVSDEEAGTRHGSEWLIENHPELLGTNPEYVINEVGGFTVHQKGKRFYPIQRAEKGVAWLRLTVEGSPGHSSLPGQDNAAAHLARAVDAISKTALPWHPGEEAAAFIAGFAAPEGALAQKISPLLLHPKIGPKFLPLAISNPSRRANIEALLRNTANPTKFSASDAINVIPGSATAEIDGRLAPGQTADDLVRELSAVLEKIPNCRFRFEILNESPATSFPTDTPLFEAMTKAIAEADPGSHTVPSIIPGFTDSKNYAKLGAHCYGFYPLQLPEDLDFAALFHGDNERIPIAGFHWGIKVLSRMLDKFLTVEEK